MTRQTFGLVIVLVLGAHARGGEVTTRDGAKHSGTIALEPPHLIVTGDGGRIVRIALDEVQEASIDPPANTSARAAGPPEHGLLGEYFADQQLARRLFERIDGPLDFDWADSVPHPLLPRGFSGRWSGELIAPATDQYTITARTDGGVRLWIDEKLLIDHWHNRPAPSLSADVRLTEGQRHAIRAEWFAARNRPHLALVWQRPRQGREVIPTDRLIPASPALRPGHTRLAAVLPSMDGRGDLRRVVEPRGDFGLHGEYFADKEMERPLFARRDAAIDFIHERDSADPLLGPLFSVRWTGRVQAQETGLHTFHITSEDGVRFWLDGRLLADRWFHQPLGFDTLVRVELEAGKLYDIRLDSYQADGRGVTALAWSTQAQPIRRMVPRECLLPPQDGKSAPALPAVILTEPHEGLIVRAPQTLRLRTAVAGQIRSVRFLDGKTTIGEATSPPFELDWRSPLPGTHALTALATDGNGASAVSDPVRITVTADADGTFPAPWAQHTFGRNEDLPTARATYAGGAFSLTTSGGNLVYHDHDASLFIHQPLVGDGQIVARVANIEPQDNAIGTFAGLMLREGFASGDRQISLLYTLDNVFFSARHRRDAEPRSVEKPAVAPCWLRVLRSGDVFRAYLSEDGRAWKLIGSERLALSKRLYVGLTASTRDRDDRSTATFDEAAVRQGPAPLASTGRGFVTRSGSTVMADVQSVRDGKLRYVREGKQQSAPIDAIARIVYQPILHETIEQLPAGQSGVLMTNDDFLQGEVREFDDGRYALDSVLFGKRALRVTDETAGLILADITDRPARWTLGLEDSSVLHAASIATEGEVLVLREPSLGELKVHASAVRRLSASKLQ